MPSMPRSNGIGKKIAYKVLGVPDNLKSKRKSPKDKTNERLVWEETHRVR